MNNNGARVARQEELDCRHGISVVTQGLEESSEKVLIEIVSAELADSIKEKHNIYCVIKDHYEQKKVLHQTSIIRQNNDPIWTVKTKSLCLMDADMLDVNRGLVDFELIHKDFKFLLERTLGRVTLRWKQVLQGDGSRVEYKLYNDKQKKGSSGSHCMVSCYICKCCICLSIFIVCTY